ncbi:ERF family protein [Streptomyces scopuliridis]|uniref:ERF family protein n=1 Tax=Streptomyces scopuliridis TaxID=452529 RepID=A0ACD4ZNX3_9ACTN|nr:ERF family protein [Streptomyces scopuliridis]WSC00110.1 ERF family protein [Streptomyces scopuliridis]
MSTLTERAAAAAGRTTAPADEAELPAVLDSIPDPAPMPDPMADYEPGEDDPEMVPVHIAWLRVRRDIRAIAKGELYNQSGTRFNFRGVDTVVNVFGPVTLKHGVNVLSSEVDAEYGEKTTKSGSKMRECTTLIRWTIMGPMGDTLTLQTRGEALDTADKSTTKSQSVALRTLLLSFGLTPTHDTDPDADRIERGEAPARSATSYRDEILDRGTTVSRIRQIGGELSQLKMLGSKVVNEVGDEETLDSLGRRIAVERAGGAA